ncbi:hypothetical protein ACTMU2_00390 [Cupriavidus basilensis]
MVVALAVSAAAMAAPAATSKAGKFDVYADALRTGKFDLFVDGTKQGRYDVYTDGARTDRYNPIRTARRTASTLIRTGAANSGEISASSTDNSRTGDGVALRGIASDARPLGSSRDCCGAPPRRPQVFSPARPADLPPPLSAPGRRFLFHEAGSDRKGAWQACDGACAG